MSLFSVAVVAAAFLFGVIASWIHSTRRLAKTLEARVRANNALLSVSAHQLRTPLNQIVGVLQMFDLQNADLTDKQKELVKILNDGTQNLKGALIDILDILDLQSGKLKIEKGEVNLERTMQSLKRGFEKRAKRKNINIDFDLRKMKHWRYKLDETRFMQCVSSLLTQCVTQTDEGTVSLCLDYLQKSKKQPGSLVVTVRDKSDGMDQHATEAYFSPEEYQINRYMTNAEGRRLSLMLARMLAREMGGDLTASSTFGGGVTFKLSIPAERAAAPVVEEVVSEVSPIERARMLLADKTVLAVDDNITNLMIVKAFLEQGKVGRIITATNGVDAIRKIAANNCDVVLMDVQMPELDGVTATRKIRGCSRPFKNVPIIALTAAARAQDAEIYKQAGMNAVLAKPVDIDDMFETIEMVLSETETRRAA